VNNYWYFQFNSLLVTCTEIYCLWEKNHSCGQFPTCAPLRDPFAQLDTQVRACTAVPSAPLYTGVGRGLLTSFGEQEYENSKVLAVVIATMLSMITTAHAGDCGELEGSWSNPVGRTWTFQYTYDKVPPAKEYSQPYSLDSGELKIGNFTYRKQ
jgi:hypothetical protein